jgi:glycosyltransferase involved in cell wall biosynthesis
MKMSRSDSTKKSALVIPFFNESNRINHLFFSSILELKLEFLIMVDDGSTDESQEIISQIVGQNKKLVWLRNEVNKGKSEALRLGFLKALDLGCDIVMTSDADGAIASSDLERALALAEIRMNSTDPIEQVYGVISGARVRLSGWQIERTTFRQWVGRVVATLVAIISRIEMYDPQSPVRAYIVNQNQFRKALREKFKTRWFSEVELILRLSNCTESGNMPQLQIYEFPLNYFKDIEGGSLNPNKIFLVLKELYLLHQVSRFRK